MRTAEEKLAYIRAWRAENPEKCLGYVRKYHLAKTYGMTLDELQTMKEGQKGCCAICGVIPQKGLNIDHDHVNGKIRGLLCWPCNIAIGHLKDDSQIVEKAAAYLRRFQK